MSNCIKCQASLSVESKFCRRCGTEQVIKSKHRAEPDAVTTNFNVSDETSQTTNNEASQANETSYSTKEIITNPLTPPTTVAATVLMTQAIREKRKKGLFIAGAIFFLMAVFGAVMTYAVISRLNYLRSTPPTISSKTSSKSGNIETAEPKIKATTENNTLPTPKTFPTPTSVLAPEPVPVKEKSKTEPMPINPPEIEGTIEDNGQITEVGVLGVKFKLVGKALVKVKGKEISVIPLIDSSVTDVTRLVVDPLPNRLAAVTGRQRASDPVSVVTIERPLPRNQFTATFAVESKASNVNQAVIVELGVRWQALPQLGKKLLER